MTHNLDAMPGVGGGICSDKDRLNAVVFDEFLQRRISFFALANLRQFRATVRQQIAHGNHFYIRVALQAKGGAEFAHAVADDAHADFSVRYRCPHSALPSGGVRLFKALDDLILGAGSKMQPCHAQARRGGHQKRTA